MVRVCHGRPGRRVKNESGVTFLGILFTVAIGGIAMAGSSALWQMETRREKEKELLFIGEEYRRAIASYHDKSPGDPQYPSKLADLVLDPRFPMPVRHLRRLYADPMTIDGTWEIIRRQDAIIGVASRSPGVPIKIANFPPEQAGFEGAARYADWLFIHSGGTPAKRNAPIRDDGD